MRKTSPPPRAHRRWLITTLVTISLLAGMLAAPEGSIATVEQTTPAPSAPDPVQASPSASPESSPPQEPTIPPVPEPISSPSPAPAPEPSPSPTAKPAPVITPGKDAAADLDKSLGPEIESERQLNAKVFTKANGSFVAKVYARPIHFEDASGKLQEIDDRIVSDVTGFKNAAGPADVKFTQKADAAELLKVVQGNNQISFSLEGAAASQSVADGPTLTYPSVQPGVDLKYVMTGDTVKELLILNERPATDSDVTFRFTMNAQGLTSQNDQAGRHRSGGRRRGGQTFDSAGDGLGLGADHHLPAGA